MCNEEQNEKQKKSRPWSDYTSGELFDIMSNGFNFKLNSKILKILEQRGVTLADQYYGTFDRDQKGEPGE